MRDGDMLFGRRSPALNVGSNELRDRTNAARLRSKHAAEKCAALLREFDDHQSAAALTLTRSEPAWVELRDGVRSYASLLRASGMSPEQTLMHVKRMVDEGVPNAYRTTRPLMDAAVTWAVEAYYAA